MIERHGLIIIIYYGLTGKDAWRYSRIFLKRPEKANKLIEHKLFDYTVLQYQTIFETVDKILNFNQSHSLSVIKTFFCNGKLN